MQARRPNQSYTQRDGARWSIRTTVYIIIIIYLH